MTPFVLSATSASGQCCGRCIDAQLLLVDCRWSLEEWLNQCDDKFDPVAIASAIQTWEYNFALMEPSTPTPDPNYEAKKHAWARLKAIEEARARFQSCMDHARNMAYACFEDAYSAYYTQCP
jgi:hypothetical protein